MDKYTYEILEMYFHIASQIGEHMDKIENGGFLWFLSFKDENTQEIKDAEIRLYEDDSITVLKVDISYPEGISNKRIHYNSIYSILGRAYSNQIKILCNGF